MEEAVLLDSTRQENVDISPSLFSLNCSTGILSPGNLTQEPTQYRVSEWHAPANLSNLSSLRAALSFPSDSWAGSSFSALKMFAQAPSWPGMPTHQLSGFSFSFFHFSLNATALQVRPVHPK